MTDVADKSAIDDSSIGGLTLEEYAEVVAHLLHFSKHSPADVLARFGLTESAFREAEVGHRIALAEESMQFRTRSLKTFARKTKDARRRLEDASPRLDEVGNGLVVPPVGPSPAPAAAASAPEPPAGDAPRPSAAADVPRAPEPARPEKVAAAPIPVSAVQAQGGPKELPSYALAAAQKEAGFGGGRRPSAPPPPPPSTPIPRVVPGPVAPPLLVPDVSPRGLPRDPAIVADDDATQTTNVLKPSMGAVMGSTGKLADMDGTGPPRSSPFPNEGVLPFKQASAADAKAPMLDPPTSADIDMSGGTVIAQSPFAGKALPWEQEPTGPRSSAAPARSGSGSHAAVPGPSPGSMTIEQYASLCAELASYPERSTEVCMRYGISVEAKASLDASFRERLTADAALQARFRELVQQYRTWIAKNRR